MVEEQIRRRGIRDERVLSVMEEVPRHHFIPKEIRHLAYADEPLPIGERADDLPTVHRRRDDSRAPAFGHGEGPRDRDRFGVPDGDPRATLPRTRDDRAARVLYRRRAKAARDDGDRERDVRRRRRLARALPNTRRSTASSPPRRRRPSPLLGSPSCRRAASSSCRWGVGTNRN